MDDIKILKKRAKKPFGDSALFCFFTEKRILISLLFRKSSFFNHQPFLLKKSFVFHRFFGVLTLHFYTLRTFSRIAFSHLKSSVVFSALYYCLPKKNRLKRGYKNQTCPMKALRLDKRPAYFFHLGRRQK